MKISLTPYLMIQFKVNWADEMNIFGYAIMPWTEWHEEKQIAKTFLKEVEEWEVGIGTNQSIYFHGYKDWVSCFQVTELSNHVALAMLAALNEKESHIFGNFITPNRNGEDIEYHRELKRQKAEEKRKKNNPTQTEIDQECNEWLEELKNTPLETDHWKKYRTHMHLNNLLALETRTPCQEQMVVEYRRILKGYIKDL